MQRKRRDLKKEKEKQEAAEKAEDAPGPLSFFCSASFSSKRKPPLFPHCAGRRHPGRQNGAKPLKKKKRRKSSEKADVCVPDAICLLVPLSSEKRICIFFPQARRVEDPEKAENCVPPSPPSFCSPLPSEKSPRALSAH